MMTLTIEIPALDRLCGILENRERTELLEAIQDEIVAKLKEAATNGTPKPVFREVAPEAQKRPQETPKAETSNVSPAAPMSAPATAEAAPVTLEGIQRAAAQLRDQGKLGNVTAIFSEFGIKRLSDLKSDQLPAFADRLRELGAKV